MISQICVFLWWAASFFFHQYSDNRADKKRLYCHNPAFYHCLTSFYWLTVNDQCHCGVLKMLYAIIYRMHVIRPPHMTLYLHLAAGDVIKSCTMYADIGVTVKTIF